MITSLLIANRGEIACRIIRTAREMGIRTVAVYSDADAKALHVRSADEAVHIGASPARESYLVGEKIIAAARATGAEAIHPGYGFLSENADFAQEVIDAGLVWVGPDPDSILAMGLKDAAKARMTKAGVPVTPGYMGSDQSPGLLAAKAGMIGFPVLIKAVAGGGGKGMRKVDRAEDFLDSLDSCKREAASSFGNDVVLLEKWIESPRHIEVQVFGDKHGNVVHLFERDCSLQRRHQKVIEEAPAPGMDEVTRAAICDAAVRAAKAVDYVGAGTIEFIADASDGLRADRIWFMEMNTRLQVEHPVTEEITGVDLVEWQLRVASGEKLPKKQDELAIKGHAIEARLYAEDPSNGFLPTSGRVEHLPSDVNGLRIETGYDWDPVPSFYDPMIAKLIYSGRDRESAIRLLASELALEIIGPIVTNAQFLLRALGHPAFRAGEIDTGFVERHLSALTATAPLSQSARDFAADYFVGLRFQGDEEFEKGDVLSKARGFRLNAPARASVQLTVDEESGEGRFNHTFGPTAPLLDIGHYFDGDTVWLNEDGRTHIVQLSAPRGAVGAMAGDGAILAPMPGKVTSVEVAAGEAVVKGQRLLTLEAMKMEHGLVAPFDGVVAELNAVAGAQVQVDAVLVRIEKSDG